MKKNKKELKPKGLSNIIEMIKYPFNKKSMMLKFNPYKKSEILRWIYWNIYRSLFPSMVHYLRKELSNYDSVLDLGCGNNSPIKYCNISYSIGVDLFPLFKGK